MKPSDPFVRAQNGAVRLAVRDLRRFWDGLDRSDPVLARRALERFWPVLIGRYGALTATMAADRFEELTGLPATMVRPVDPERANGRMRWGLDPIFSAEPDHAAALGLLVLLTDELVKQPGRSTLARSASENQIGLTRVTVGKTCDWCEELAAEAVVYGPEAAQSLNSWHGNCDCVLMPSK